MNLESKYKEAFIKSWDEIEVFYQHKFWLIPEFNELLLEQDKEMQRYKY